MMPEKMETRIGWKKRKIWRACKGFVKRIIAGQIGSIENCDDLSEEKR